MTELVILDKSIAVLPFKSLSDDPEDLYRYALEYDFTFAKAYAGLAWVYWFKSYNEDYHSDKCLDSVLILANIALSYDEQLADGYILRGSNYKRAGKGDQAIKEYDKALKLNPNN